MIIGPDFEVIEDARAPKGRRIVRKGEKTESRKVSENPAIELQDDYTGVKHTGAGWYEIWAEGVQVSDNVRGKEAAEAALAEFLA